MGDLLLRDVRIVALAPGDLVPEGPVDVLVAGGVVAAIGERLARPAGTEEYAGEGRWLIPGLWDAHTHLAQWTLAASRLDLHGTGSAEEVLQRVAAAVPTVSAGEALIGSGHSAGTWPRPGTVAELDAVTGEVPTILVNQDFHHAWLNSAALRALGLPPRDGVVMETEWYAAYPRAGELYETAGGSPAAYRRMLERAAALGIVGMVDLEVGTAVEGWRERWHEGCDLVRIRAATYADGLDAVIKEGLRSGDPLLPGEDRLTMGPLKIISDGSLGTRTAWCCEPYADPAAPSGHHGAPNLTAAELRDLLGRAHENGLHVATHAIGDRAVSEALQAYAATGARGTIEHAQLLRRVDVDEMARLGVTASVQPAHLLDDRAMTEEVWPGRAERCFALRWLADAGVRLALGSDAPVAPLDPWLAIAAAVGRSADGTDPWHPEQALTAQEALAASVDGRGTVRVGAPADLVVLDRDPLTATVADLAAAGSGVALTVAAGRVTHRS